MPRSSTPRRREPEWARWDDERLLRMPIRRLRLSIRGSRLEPRLRRLRRELAARGLRFRPHVWLSTEWFSPGGLPGFAIPFYLAHPRLERLERTMMTEAEGASADECMRILRHETGHAIDHAYRLSRRPRWRRHFGDPTQPYPDAYDPSPYSRRFVQNIDNWYAQAHPVEDFAETFAVWLAPGTRWRTRYEGWPALRKLEYVEELMGDVARRPPPVRRRERVDPVAELDLTLAEHYAERRARYQVELPEFYDRDLRRLFPERPAGSGERTEPASRALRRVRKRVRAAVARWTGAYQYSADRILQEMIDRCDELGLRAPAGDDEAALDAAVLLCVHVMNELRERGRFLL